MLPTKYNEFREDLQPAIPKSRLITDPLRTLAYGTDASFYRLIPRIVIKADTEKEVALILKTDDRHDIPVTFRAAGTSLCGQACAQKVVVPKRAGCCGSAGDRGFTHPELNESALNELRPAVSETCSAGYSNSRTCEIGLSLHSGLYYKSILYLVDER